MNTTVTAILIDGGFFHKRYHDLYPQNKHTAAEAAKNLYTFALRHVEGESLYRIFYYDCLPLNKRIHNPISNEVINFDLSPIAEFRKAFFEELKRKRKVALRLGYVKDSGNWLIKPGFTKKFLFNKSKGQNNNHPVGPTDIFYEMQQKGVDMKIGVDIASLAYKKLVNKIILMSGDVDFVPAAKLARREGIDFVLDPLWNNVPDMLFEHIDGLHSTAPKPKSMSNKISGDDQQHFNLT